MNSLKSFVLTLLAFSILSLTGCGVPDGQDGRDGRPGPQGKDGVDGRDGVDGVDGAPGRDGQDATGGKLVIAHTHCELSGQTYQTTDGYPKFDLLYEVSVMNDESALVSFVERQFFRAGAQPNVTSNTRFYVKGEPGYDVAAIESTMWKAELKTATSVNFSYKGGSFTKTVECK